MNRFFILTLLLVVYLAVFAKGHKKKYTLPGVILVKGSYLYASTTEVRNLDYLEFLTALKKAGLDSMYKNNLPDTAAWLDKLAYVDPFVEYYFRHPSYREYPVVNISYENALNYCAWLTDTLNAFLKRNNSYIKKVVVRLPTEEEWEYAARGGLDETAIYPWGTTSLRCIDKKHEGVYLANFKRGLGDNMGVAGSLNDASDIPNNVYSYWPNDYGLYNISGNVAEMIQEKGKTKGGSWKSFGYYLRIDAEEKYEKPCPEVGFRYFIEVLELNEVERKKDIALTPKYIENSVSQTNDSIYAGKYEVTNRLYNIFLEDLKQNNPSEYKNHLIDNTKWNRYSDYPYIQIYGWYPDYDKYPVVNIKYESAVEFCNWLTEKYNSFPKRKYKKVIFRLPSEKEWEYAANWGCDLCPYPWGGPYATNSKGHYFCNFNPHELRFMKKDENNKPYYDYPNNDISISRGLDGGDMTMPVDSYLPNDFGLYNCSGNVAEMINEKGITKGGSWISIVDNIKIISKETYSEAQPYIGFRYFMEIIEK